MSDAAIKRSRKRQTGLARPDTAVPTVAATGLIAPVSLAFDEATDDLFILELRGQILKVHIN